MYTKFNMQKVWFGICLALTGIVIYTTLSLKLISYDKIPAPGTTFDEYSFAWTGKSFLQSGLPISWTTNLGIYQQQRASVDIDRWGLKVNGVTPTWSNAFTMPKPANRVITFDYGLGDRQIALVQPYFDHPPLAGIIYALSIPKNVSTLTAVRPQDFRHGNVVLGVLTASLLFVLGWLLYSPSVGFLATLIYSTTPTTILSARLTMAENVIIPFFLASMILMQLGLRYKKLWLFGLSGLLAGACTMAKFSGISAAAAGLLILYLSHVNRKQVIIFSLAFLASIMPYLIYANLLSANLFWRVIINQSSRGNWGFINLTQSISRLNFPGFPIDAWWAGGLVSLFYLMNNKKHLHLSVMSLAYVLVATLLGGDYNAWYFFPLGVFACLAWGVLIAEIATLPSLINISIFFLFGVMSSLYWGYIRINSLTNFSWPIRIIAGLFIISGLVLPKLVAQNKALKYVWIIILIVLMHRLYLWNVRGFQEILVRWGHLPYPLMLPLAN